jgi:putative membrane-bound dehydrogenase-like protein
MENTFRRPLVVVAGGVLLLWTGAAQGQGYAPAEAVRRMTVPDGLTVRVVASEPMIRQPVAIEFDDRGRLWGIQYLQYPNPSGLKRVQVDRYSRTVYDAVPPPPPRGPKGGDRITILEDTDGDGAADRAKDFLSGLNLATGLAFGHGGVFVLQVPYLLFYPDRNRDDVPDGDPEVLLSGFGMEDAHSVANSLTWGPDGWLYGLQGSTVTAHVRGSTFQQGVWRYHPLSQRFELFCEGGGNMWGLDYDAHGNLFASTNVGGSLMLHAVPGAYCWKSFGKHGPLHNPYTFGYFDHVEHRAHGAHEGHVAVGGLFYHADAFPERFRGQYISGDLLAHSVHWNRVERRGSTFRSSHAGDLLLANDTWFACTDLTLGPDGAVYVTDWHDKRTAHPDPDADWDRSNGRVYAIAAQGTKPIAQVHLESKSSAELVDLLSHPNVWYVRKARRLLADRRDPSVWPRLRVLALDQRTRSASEGIFKNGRLGLEALWALAASGGFDAKLAVALLDHPNEDIRVWTVRLLGDEGTLAPELGTRLTDLGGTDPSVLVRAQLASTAQRLPADQGLPIVERILRRDVDGDDPHIPLLLWWAVERHAVASAGLTLDRLASASAWESALNRRQILGRLMKRYAADGSQVGDESCARLLASAPSADGRRDLLTALDEGLRLRPRGADPKGARLAAVLGGPIETLWRQDRDDTTLIRLAARLGLRAARAHALSLATHRGAPEPARRALLGLLEELDERPDCGPLLTLVTGPETEAIQAAAFNVLKRDQDDRIVAALLAAYPSKGESWRSRARELLLSRKPWARAFLTAIDRGEIPGKDIPLDQLRSVALHQDSELDALVRKHWGRLKEGTPGEKLAEVRRLHNDLRAAPGNADRGRLVYQKHCAVCHRLFNEGNLVGPELTHANRADRDFLLISLVDPGAVIRKEYQSVIVSTRDGRILSGLIAEQTPSSVTIVGAKNERTNVPREAIEEMKDSPQSLMPADLYRQLTPDDLRDLFHYLQGDVVQKASR